MNSKPRLQWTAEDILELARSYQGAAVLAAAADLDLFAHVANGPQTAANTAGLIGGDRRGTTVLLDALVALGLLKKEGNEYSLPPELKPYLTAAGAQSVLAMAQHQANCLRRWAQLAEVVKTGRPAERRPSVRGESGDEESFIGAMHNISARMAAEVIRGIEPLEFRHLLDIGGASGTWTMAFLRACPAGRATLFDLPQVIPMAEQRLKAEGFADRVALVGGDFNAGELPGGADLAWVSAIVHQNSRAQNRELFARTARALVSGGRIAIRDMVMEPDRTRPVPGALFAVNMLVATEGGGTFTFEELSEDLLSAGFGAPEIRSRDQGMNSVVVARKAG